jgi:four helix bundle protein
VSGDGKKKGGKMRVESFRDLRVWQAGMELVEEVYRVTRTFPRQETYGLANQLQRAAVSIPSNIAEGHARHHLKEYVQHLAVAQSSLAELETQLEIAGRLGYLPAEDLSRSLQRAVSLGRQLYALRNALQNRHPTPVTRHPS